MSWRDTLERIALAYPRGRRVRDAMKHVAAMAKIGNGTFEGTVSAKIADTYGVETDLVKRMKARKRCELSFSEGVK